MARKLVFKNQITLRIGDKAKRRIGVIAFRRKEPDAVVARALLYKALNLKEEDERI